jgi:hypothetical protein
MTFNDMLLLHSSYIIPQRRDSENDGSNLLMSGKYTFNYPNFEAESHWAFLIHFLGPVWAQNTKFWEAKHRVMKVLGRNTNQQDIGRDVLNLEMRALSTQFGPNAILEQNTSHRPDMSPFGTSKASEFLVSYMSNQNNKIRTQLSQHGEKVLRANNNSKKYVRKWEILNLSVPDWPNGVAFILED